MAGVVFTDDAADALVEAARYTLANRSILGGPAGAPVVASGPVMAYCASATTTSGGLYPGVVAEYVYAAGEWLEYGACWLKPANGEAMTSGDYYLAMPCGQTADGTPVFIAVVTCCGGGSSGSGGGGGGGEVVSPCCPGQAMPRRLYMAISGGGACDGTYPLDYDDTAGRWVCLGTVGTCGLAWKASFVCQGGGSWVGFFANDVNYINSVTHSCSPFRFTCNQEATYPPTCGCTAGYTMTVTDTPPAPCCGDVTLPSTLHATITAGGPCNGSYALTQAGGGSLTWNGTGPSGTSIQLACVSGAWSFQLLSSMLTFVSNDCSSPTWTFTSAGAIGPCTAGLTVTVTA